MKENKYIYELDFKVRDYECDLQGIVNNANYQHYLEHARHEFLKSRNLDFAELHKEGKDGVVTRIEIDFKYPLKSGDEFKVKLYPEPQGRFRMVFYQDIYENSQEKIIIQAKVTAVILSQGRPIPNDLVFNKL